MDMIKFLSTSINGKIKAFNADYKLTGFSKSENL